MAYFIDILMKFYGWIPTNVRRKLLTPFYPLFQVIISKKLSKIVKNSFISTPLKPAVLGAFRSRLGHTRVVKLLVKEFELNSIFALKYDVSNLLSLPITNDNENYCDDDIMASDSLIIALNPEELLYILWKLPTEIITGKKIIGYFVWELEEIPPKWGLVKGLLHEIWTPTKFCQKPLQEFFDVPVKIVPHPAALLPPPPIDITRGQKMRADLGIAQDAFIAFQSFTFASSLERKNVIGAAKAFSMAFNKSDNAFLIIRYLSANLYPKALMHLASEISKMDCNIILIDGRGSIENLHDLYSAADLYISLHRAEGFGLNIAESMLIGLPVMTTNWSGNIEFTNDDTAFMIPVKLVQVSDDSNIYKMKNARWAEPDLVYASQTLAKIYENPEILKEKALNAKEYAFQKLSGGNAKIALHENI